jgi:hypothetical protein
VFYCEFGEDENFGGGVLGLGIGDWSWRCEKEKRRAVAAVAAVRDMADIRESCVRSEGFVFVSFRRALRRALPVAGFSLE